MQQTERRERPPPNSERAAAVPQRWPGRSPIIFTEIAKDGLPIPASQQTAINEIDAAPGGSYDVAFTADRLGVWAFHCHILDHVTGPNGEMAGMITVVKVLPR